MQKEYQSTMFESRPVCVYDPDDYATQAGLFTQEADTILIVAAYSGRGYVLVDIDGLPVNDAKYRTIQAAQAARERIK